MQLLALIYFMDATLTDSTFFAGPIQSQSSNTYNDANCK